MRRNTFYRETHHIHLCIYVYVYNWEKKVHDLTWHFDIFYCIFKMVDISNLIKFCNPLKSWDLQLEIHEPWGHQMECPEEWMSLISNTTILYNFETYNIFHYYLFYVSMSCILTISSKVKIKLCAFLQSCTIFYHSGGNKRPLKNCFLGVIEFLFAENLRNCSFTGNFLTQIVEDNQMPKLSV